ncbi:MAG: hypothetical protein D6723_19975 [Acidobacteria bacterium]|nr:MAG: hypothetical protein D6723_19975 [Acidobacteriota bacterium]
MDVRQLEEHLDHIEQEVQTLRREIALLRQMGESPVASIESLQRASCIIARRMRAAFDQLGIPDQPTMSIRELQAALGTALPANALTHSVLRMREE